MDTCEGDEDNDEVVTEASPGTAVAMGDIAALSVLETAAVAAVESVDDADEEKALQEGTVNMEGTVNPRGTNMFKLEFLSVQDR